jgi:hypothetical protein
MGAGDHDEQYSFGRKPHVDATFPFSAHQYARLLILRSRYSSERFDSGWRDAA